jgi:putative glycosyltransferase (TIGR04372 family)
MKVLISNAVWGEKYCSVFTTASLASLLADGNIPGLSKRASITFHIVTTLRDRPRLEADAAVARLREYCAIEWEVAENFAVYSPPTGHGGEKYPFLSALQNIAIERAIGHDVIVFNYADFIWADGSLASTIDMISQDRPRPDAVLAFCLPVDRDAALPALEKYRQSRNPTAVTLSPRNGAKIAIERMHREARNRYWDSPGFTNLPSYMIWNVGDQGVVMRAYHQSVLAMRVRPEDPGYLRGIERASLDAYMTAQLAERGNLAFANDAEKVLVFSLYDTIVDSRLPPGETRESSLQGLLRAIVTPAQRRFAEQPIHLRLRDGDPGDWRKAEDESWRILDEAQKKTPFDREAHDAIYQTHGLIPRLERIGPLRRAAGIARHRVLEAVATRISFGNSPFAERLRFALKNPALAQELAAKLTAERLSEFYPGKFRRMVQLFRRARNSFYARRARLLWILRAQRSALARFLRLLHWPPPVVVAPNIIVDRKSLIRFSAAIDIEDSTTKAHDSETLRGNLRTAETVLLGLINEAPVWADVVRALGRNHWFQGRFEEAMRTFASAEKLRDVTAWIAGLPTDNCVFLPRNCIHSIGLMGHIEAFVKHKLLTDDRRPYYLLAPEHEVVNPAFLGYWTKYITVISDPVEIANFTPLEIVYGVNWNWVFPKDGGIVFVHVGMADIHRQWKRAGRPPLLLLNKAHAERLMAARAKWGMKENDRFVCLHVRSEGFYGEAREHAQRFRNTAVEDYYPMIRTVTDMGYWVIRMGDPSMPPLDLAQCGTPVRVVDYALSPERSAALDVALCAECTLFVSSPSGLHTVAHSFGRPVCEVNYPIYSGFPWHPGDIFIPQLYFSEKENRTLGLGDILGTDIVSRDHHFLLEQVGITLIPNDPDEITETVLEALSPSTYTVDAPERAEAVRVEFDSLNSRHDRGISGQLGKYFSMKYAPQLLSGGGNP